MEQPDQLPFEGMHLKLHDLMEEACARGYENNYIYKNNIPEYPRPEFHVAHLKHDTNQVGLFGIRGDSGFKDPQQDTGLLWWSLTVTPDEISSAERRLLEETFPDRTEEQIQLQESFLEKFLTSPSFDGTSRLGSYRFTFTVEELLKAYSEQFCSGHEPVMRTFKTILYKQEVMYAVLVHRPSQAYQEHYSRYPLLTDDPDAVCRYRDGRFIWRPEAMSGTHNYELIQRNDEKRMDTVMEHPKYCQYYVWDHIAIVLDVDEQVLSFQPDRLRENLTICKKGKPTIVKPSDFQELPIAEEFVKTLWPDWSSPLKC